MFEPAPQYMKRSREERQKHLKLDEPCVEIGGNSTTFRGLLAHFLKTTIPDRKIHLCHACNNAGCSNVKHMYWGSAKDNFQDQVENGRPTIAEYLAQSRTQEELKDFFKAAGSKGGKALVGSKWLRKDGVVIRVKAAEVQSHLDQGYEFGR
jgi:hypothetical protein